MLMKCEWNANEMRMKCSNVAETSTDVSTDAIDNRCQDCEHALALNGSHVKALSDFTEIIHPSTQQTEINKK